MPNNLDKIKHHFAKNKDKYVTGGLATGALAGALVVKHILDKNYDFKIGSNFKPDRVIPTPGENPYGAPKMIPRTKPFSIEPKDRFQKFSV